MPENQNTEWKEAWHDEYLKWVCGFANADDGTIFIGKDDEGRTVGLAKPDKLMNDIPNKIRSGLGIVCDVSLHDDGGKHYIRIDVDPSPFPVSCNGEYHYRSGATKQQLKGNALTRFIFERTGMSWESAPIEDLSVSDFRNDAFDTFREQALRAKRITEADAAASNKDLMRAMSLIDDDGRVTRAGALLFHQEPQRWVPCATTRIGFFANDADVLYEDEVGGPLIEQAVKVPDLLFTKYTIAPIGYEGFSRVESSTFPEAAVRELVYNALVHTNRARMVPVQISVYADKLYIGNEAVLPRGLTVEKLLGKHRSEPYNPLTAQAFYRAGFIESWGRGIEKVRTACEASGVPMAAFELDDTGVMARLDAIPRTIAPADQVTDQVTDQVARLLKALGGRELSATELMRALELKHRQTFRDNYLNPAIDAGLVEMTIPDKPRSGNQKYRRKAGV